MRKKFLFLMLILCLPIVVFASDARVSVSAPSSVYIGDTVKVSVTVSSSASIGSWQYNISYDDSKLSFISTTAENSQSVANSTLASGKHDITYSWNFKAIGEGNASFNANGFVIGDFDSEEAMNVSGGKSFTINIIKPSNNTTSGGGSKKNNTYKYSTNNNLSALVVEGFDFSFDPNVTDYSITVPNDTKSVKVGATASDGKAKVSGIGDYNVLEGDNPIPIVVEAENGSKKVYNINVVVKELEPININIGDDAYTIIRKADLLPQMIATFNLDTVLINGYEVPCYKSSLVDFSLVGLRDKDGNISLYMYKDDNFKVYRQLKLSGMYIALLDADCLKGYVPGDVKINESVYSGFVRDDAFPLIYGINLETGDRNYYSYDSVENTIQRYVVFEIEKDITFYYPYIAIGLLGLCFIEFIVIARIVSLRNKKLKKMVIDTFDRDKFNDESNITDDLTDEYMESLDDDSVESNGYIGVDENSLDEATEDFSNDDSSLDSTMDDSFENTSEVTFPLKDDINRVFDNNVKKKKSFFKKKKNKDDDMYHF